ncbi:MAG: 2-octaprenyl-6-methoxyphenyl hydroxylase [Woeseiaceae bacterium]
MPADGRFDFDLIVAGGGMIGTSLALAIEPLGLRVAVVEPVPREREQQPSFDDRSTALSRSTQRMYEAMGLWPRIVEAATPILSIHVSEKGRFGFSHLHAGEQGVESLGYVVINRVLGEVLHDSLADSATTTVLSPARIAGVATGDAAALVSVMDGGREWRLRCRLLVAADGANSATREMLGIGAARVDYGQHAVIGNLQPEIPPQNRAWERFTVDGAIALLPLGDDRAAFIWILPSALAAEHAALSDAAFIDRLQSAFGTRLGAFSRVGGRAVYPLALSKARALVAPRGVLIGNAAHGLHPVAAQGFNLGMRDVAALCDCLLDALRSGGGDIGSATVLNAYAAWRRPDQLKLVRFTDGLVRLFGDRRRAVGVLRNLGMLGFDMVPGVRKLFARHSMGLAGPLPRLSRGVPLK